LLTLFVKTVNRYVKRLKKNPRVIVQFLKFLLYINHYPKSKSFYKQKHFWQNVVRYKVQVHIILITLCHVIIFFLFWEQCVKSHYIVSYMKYPGVGCCERILPQTFISSNLWGWGGEGGSTRSQHHDPVMKYSLCVGTCRIFCELCTKVSAELFFSWLLFLFLIWVIFIEIWFWYIMLGLSGALFRIWFQYGYI
jgi:hypothetical protein